MPLDLDGYVSVDLFPPDGSSGGSDGYATARPPDYVFDATVRPGQYTIRANVPPGEPPAYGHGSVSVTGDISGVVIAMSPAPEIVGRITVAESGAQVNLKDVRVELRGPTGYGGVSDSTGRFTISKIWPGNYSIESIRALPDGCYILDVTFGGQEISWDGFEIAASGRLEIVLSNAAGQIAGTVSDADGKPFPISTVTLVTVDGKSRPAKQAVDDSGAFKFTNVRPGVYKLFAWEEIDDDLWPDPGFRKKYEDRAIDVAVVPHETQTVQVRVIPFEAMN